MTRRIPADSLPVPENPPLCVSTSVTASEGEARVTAQVFKVTLWHSVMVGPGTKIRERQTDRQKETEKETKRWCDDGWTWRLTTMKYFLSKKRD